MDEPIKRGDLVVVVNGCPKCGATDSLGTVFTVQWLGMASGATNCCGHEYSAISADDKPDGDDAWDICRLKRIPPLGELEDTPTQERIEA